MAVAGVMNAPLFSLFRFVATNRGRIDGQVELYYEAKRSINDDGSVIDGRWVMCRVWPERRRLSCVPAMATSFQSPRSHSQQA